MAYTYQVLTQQQIKLLDDYSPWASKVRLSQLIDESLIGQYLGLFNYVTVLFDLTVNQNAYIAGDAYVAGSLNVGGGYGDTGFTVDEDGNVTTDGYGDFTVSGIGIREEVIANSGTVGKKGDTCYGFSGGFWYLYICVETNTWQRVTLASF